MKRRLLKCLLLVALVALAIVGCNGKAQRTWEAPRAIQTPTSEMSKEVRSGFYMSNDPANFPLPTSGFDIYIVGEMHGNQETKQLFQTYLNALYKDASLRDVVLEEHQAYEPDANEYVSGKTDVLPEELCRRTDILRMIREFNATLSMNDKVVVHLVDVDSPLLVIYKHLTELHTQLGSNGISIQIPPLSEMETWSPKLVYDLMDNLQSAAADQPDILEELETLRLSFRWYFLGNELDSDTKVTMSFMPLREDIITQNIQNLISRLNDKPVITFFGWGHAMKATNVSEKPWAQRLSEAGIDIYSLHVAGISGKGYWRGETYDYVETYGQYQFADGSYLPSLFGVHFGTSMIYADLRVKENQEIKMLPGYSDMPANRALDGIILFKQFTPMKNACHELK